jgi:hypothetical protein
MSDANMEHREQTRHDFLSNIEFILEPPANGGTLHRGVIINLNSKGLGVYILEQLTAGQKIIIKTGLPIAHQQAAICWIRKEKASFCRAGLKLL